MYQTFDEAAVDDLFYEAAEGPAISSFDDFDLMLDDESYDALEDVIVNALSADDADEFLGGLVRGLAGLVRRGARNIPQAARAARSAYGRVQNIAAQAHRYGPQIKAGLDTVSGVANLIPGPTAQAISQTAQALSDSMPADEADEFELLDAMVDWAEDEGDVDAIAPVMAGLALRTAMPAVTRLSRPVQRQLVRSVAQATRTLAHRQGPQAARAVVPIVRSVQQTAQQRRLPTRAIPTTIRQRAAQVARSPHMLRRLATPSRVSASRIPTRPGLRRPGRVQGRSMTVPYRSRSYRSNRSHPLRRGTLLSSRLRRGVSYRGTRIPSTGLSTGRVLSDRLPSTRVMPGRRPRIPSAGLGTASILSDRLPSTRITSSRQSPLSTAPCTHCGRVHRYRTCRPVYISVRGC